MNIREILALIFLLIPVVLVGLPFFDVWLLDQYFHVTMLFLAWPVSFAILFLGSILDELVDSPHIILISQSNRWRYEL